MVVGTIIGASIFVQPSEVTGHVPSVVGIYAVWAIAGLLTLCGSVIAAELASAFPRTGGVYVFLKEAYSPALGFLWGWAMFWTMHTGIIAAIAMVFARYVAFFLPMSATALRAVAISAVLLLSAINYVGVRQGSTLQTSFTLVKLIAVAAVIALGFALGPRVVVPPAPATSIGLRGLLLAVAAGLFAFGGWHMVTYAAGETIDPRRTIPRALAAGTILVTLCYVLLNAAYLHVLPLATVVSSSRVAADAADAVLGGGGAAVMSALVAFSSLGALSGIVLAGPRAYLSMAEDGLLFRWVAEVHPRFRTPHRAIALQATWAAVLIATGSYRVLVARVIYTEWIFFALMALGLLALRRRAAYAPAYRVPFFPVLPMTFATISLLVVVNQIAAQPLESAVGLLLVLAGWPIYQLWLRRTLGSPRSRVLTHGD
jgi:APA family basic amino acid/polyamine antiporter